ncbi:MAG TPA: ABC transporter permease [Mycobacteriales bacterium]|nr:ABC transporter permease [Mycobacteriales bacterium]
MNGARLVAHQIRYEQKAYWRNPASAFFTFAFPVMFLVIFASLNRGARLKALGNISFDQYYVPAIIAFGVMSACYTNLAIALATRRQLGLLKRLRATPLPAWGLLGGMLGNSLVVSFILTALTTTLGILAYGVHAPYHVLPLVVALLVGGATFCALGIAVSTLVPNPDAAPPIVNFPFFILAFISGTFFPVASTSTLARVANYFPLVHFRQAVFAPFDPLQHGSAFAWHDLRTMTIWLVAASLFAVRRFRWEPRRG